MYAFAYDSQTFSCRMLVIGSTVLLLTGGVSGVITDRGSAVSQQIYEKITDNYACFRRMNATHQVGCTSKRGGSVGVLQLVETDSDFDWKGPHSPYIALIYLDHLTLNILEKFQNLEEDVNGVILLGRNESSEELIPQYSPDQTCPNRGYGFYTNTSYSNFCPKWNKPGNGILHRNWNFPIFYVSSDTSTKILLDCYHQHNKPNNNGVPREWPLCAAELESFMYSAVDTQTCIRRNKLNEVSVTPSIVCDPLGDANVWSTILPINQTKPYSNRSVIVIAARLDATSMFEQISPGADSAATGITAVLALIKQLAPMKELISRSTTVSNIYFILFNGEAYDYIGSSRIVYDISKENFPYKVDAENAENFPALLHLEDVMYYIELNQLSLSSPRDSYYIHRNWDSSAFDKGFNELVKIFEKKRLSTRIAVANNSDFGVPPSSLQSFLAQTSDFPGIVITNHEKEYMNRHYNSYLDDAENIHYDGVLSDTVKGIASLVALLSATIEELITGQTRPFFNSMADPVLINDILECYVKTPTCQLFQTVTNDTAESLASLPKSMYVGVPRRINAITTITQHVMGFHQGAISNRTTVECQRREGDAKMFQYMWISGSCYETTASATSAVSPAFDDIDNYNWKSGRYSTWTESIWADLRVRIFLKVSKTHEVMTLVSGLIVFAFSIVLFSWINNNAETLFKSRITNGVNGVC